MSKRTYNNEELAELFESEGTAYAIQNYIDVKDIEDPEIRDLARLIKEDLDRIEMLLNL
jgi:hypothetical protein